MATYAIGDIQGCFSELQHLLDRVEFSSQDTLWFCGDIVNRGPQSLETLRFIHSLGDQAVVVLGNHDLHMLAVWHGGASFKKSDTLRSVFEAEDKAELLNWLQQQPLLHHDSDLGYTMVHAGIPPCWSLSTAQKLAQEVEGILRSHRAKDFFLNMYGNQPDQWSRSLEGWDRLRLITNYLTRMRFCTTESQIEFVSKGGLETQPDNFLPWYLHPNRKTSDQRIVFGHWAALEGKADHPNVFALDTGCVWGSSLTAMRLEDQTLFTVPSQQHKLL